MNHLKDTTVLVLGLGESGLAMARWCAGQGANVRVWDSREQAPNEAALAEHVPQAKRLTVLDDAAVDGVNLVLKSPGLAPNDERIAGAMAKAADAGALVQNELTLFARALADLKEARGYAPKVIAITGTNGKTTVTAMTRLLVERTGKRAAMAGNVGPTMLQTLADALVLEAAAVEMSDADAAGPHPSPPPEGEGASTIAVEVSESTEELPPLPGEGWGGGQPQAQPPQPTFAHLPDVWVLELSSFQLDSVTGFEPSAATVLNITEDHLDWHGSMAAYTEAKSRIFGKHAVMVINRDDPKVEKLVPEPIPQKGRNAKPIERHVVRFGLNAPQHPGDFGLIEENGMAWLIRAMELDETDKPKRGAVIAPEDLHIQRLMPADALRVRGRHNAANALAALALATAIGCPLAPMLHGLREYAGEPHRVEFVATVNQIDAFDDSKGTNVGATVAALDGLGADKAPSKLIVILGGDGKGQDFAPLASPVGRHVRAIATIGRDAAAIEEALANVRAQQNIALQRHDTLDAAIAWCFEQAQAGDAVLLSPACASLDMFRNYAHRAQVFVDAVKALAMEKGEAVA